MLKLKFANGEEIEIADAQENIYNNGDLVRYNLNIIINNCNLTSQELQGKFLQENNLNPMIINKINTETQSIANTTTGEIIEPNGDIELLNSNVYTFQSIARSYSTDMITVNLVKN